MLSKKLQKLHRFRCYSCASKVKHVYNDHPWDPKIVIVVDRWSLFRGRLCTKSSKWNLKIVVVIDRWSLFGGGRYLSLDCIQVCSVLTKIGLRAKIGKKEEKAKLGDRQ